MTTKTTRREISSYSSKPLPTRFAHNFLKALMKIKRSSPFSSTDDETKIRRHTHRIKLASYSSMARAVGSRRAWSRALISKLITSRRSKRRCRSLSSAIGSRRWKRSKTVTKRKKGDLMDKRIDSGVDELRQLVPGGELMDPCILLEETAHFVRCLETQVRVMRSIADNLPC